mmetsp:Transcript_72007/g.150440  ORF Transcript_72007/g.150440 Transcript_72007/m.150440 type:complete len:625 (+) Transcript_72007:39-1913(+)
MAAPSPRSSNVNSPTAASESMEGASNAFCNRSGPTTRSQGAILTELPSLVRGLQEAACISSASPAGGKSIHASPPTNSSSSGSAASPGGSAAAVPPQSDQAETPAPTLQRANGVEHLGSTAIDTVEPTQAEASQEQPPRGSSVQGETEATPPASTSPRAASSPEVLQTPPPKASKRQPARDTLTPELGQPGSASEGGASAAKATSTPQTKVRAPPPPLMFRSSGGKRLFGAALKAKQAKKEREAKGANKEGSEVVAAVATTAAVAATTVAVVAAAVVEEVGGKVTAPAQKVVVGGEAVVEEEVGGKEKEKHKKDKEAGREAVKGEVAKGMVPRKKKANDASKTPERKKLRTSPAEADPPSVGRASIETPPRRNPPRKSAILSGYASPSMDSKLQAAKAKSKAKAKGRGGSPVKLNKESPKAKRYRQKESPSPAGPRGDRGLALKETQAPVPLGRLGLGSGEARNTRSKRLRIPTLEHWRNESVRYRRLPGSPMPEIAGIQLNLAPRPDTVPLRNLGALLQAKPGRAVDRSAGYEAVGVPGTAFQSSIFTLPVRTSKAQERSVRVGPALGILYVAQGSIRCHMDGRARNLKPGDTLCFNDTEKTAVIEPSDDDAASFRFIRVSSA